MASVATDEHDLAGYDGPHTPTDAEWPDVLELSRAILFSEAPDLGSGAQAWPMICCPGASEAVLVMLRGGVLVSLMSGRAARVGLRAPPASRLHQSCVHRSQPPRQGPGPSGTRGLA